MPFSYPWPMPNENMIAKPIVQNYSHTLKDGVRVHPKFKDGVLPNVLGNSTKCVRDLFVEALTKGWNRPFLGTHSSPYSPYEWITFSDVYSRMKKFGSGLLTLDSLSESLFQCVGIFGKNRPEWLIAEYTCACYKMVSVPLYDTLGDEALLYICNQAELSVVVCDTADRAIKLLGLSETIPFLKHIVIMNSGDDLNPLKASTGTTIQVFTFDEVIALGASTPRETMASQPEDLVLICYTSGTTGLPKGVEVSNRMILASLNNNILNSGPGIFTENDTYMSYLPLAHIFEQMFIILAIFNRGRIGFYSGDPRQLSDDAKILKPTVWTTVPRVLLRIYEGVQSKIGASSFKKWLFKTSMVAKLKDVDQGIMSHKSMWDMIFFSKVRALFGGHIRVIVIEGYGSTETASSLSSAYASDLDGGHIGAPVPGLLVKLVDIPSMGIVAARDSKGEICVKGPSCTTGYYKNPEQTAQLFDSEGWLHTGDVGVWTDKNSLKIVDRCKHIFKLSQGEYVAPEKIELAYQESELVNQVFVDGDAQQAYPVAIVIPDFVALARRLNHRKVFAVANGGSGTRNGNLGQKQQSSGEAPSAAAAAATAAATSPPVNATGEHTNGVTLSGVEEEEEEGEEYVVHGRKMTKEQLCEYEPAITAVLSDLTAIGKARGLKGFEQARAIRLSSVSFTIENRMLTPTMKSAREVIRKEFAPAIKSLYHTTNAASSRS